MIILVFDIETIPDIATGKQLHNLAELSDDEAYLALQKLAQQKNAHSTFLPHYLHKIVAISCVLASHDAVRVWSLGDEHSDEKDLIERFFAGIEKFNPQLVSWNGSGFDLPVLHYRALKHSITASHYFETGQNDNSFRWNNYLSRFHERHLDLMDVIAGYQNRAFAPLDAIASMLGFAGKMGMDGSKVFSAFQNGELDAIRNYCETDVLNTYLVYCRFELLRGHYNQNDYHSRLQQLHNYLNNENKPHFSEFIANCSALP